MNLLALLKRIDELRLAAGIESELALVRLSGVGKDFLRNIRRGISKDPGAEDLMKIANQLGTSVDDLMTAAMGPQPRRIGAEMVPIERIEVIGQVKAGTWQDAVEWHATERKQLHLPIDTRYPGLKRFGLELEGDSLNLLYPLPKTTVICIPFTELDREPENEEVVLAQRRRHDLVEATCKVYVTRNKETWLEPRSSNPVHKPIRVIRSRAELAKVPRDRNTVTVDPAALPDHPKDLDSMEVTALVTGAYVQQ